MIIKHMKLRALILLFVASFASISYADTEIENATLARIRNVLNSLTPLINEAEQQQDKNARMQFRYDWLRADINQIKQGLEQKLGNPSIQPRTVTPIKGDYLVLKSKQK